MSVLPWVRTWRVVLRFAARDARRNRASTLLVAVMVGLPVLAASFVDVAGRSAALDPQDVAGVQLGSHATALVTVGFGGALVQSPDGQQVEYSGETSDAARSDLLRRLPAALPAGRHLSYLLASGGLDARVGDRQLPVDVGEVDYDDPMLAGWSQQLSGYAPQTPDEVVVTAKLADDAGLRVGDALTLHAATTLADGTRPPDRPVSVVGVVRVPSLLGQDAVLGRPGTLLPGKGVSMGATPGWFVDGPAVSWSQVRALNALGAVVISRSVLESPPSIEDIPELNQGTSPASGTVLGILTVAAVLVLLQITLLAGPALAVGARRNQRTLALMAAAGGSPSTLRRAVLASGIVVGLVSSLACAVLGVVTVQLARGPLEDYSGGPIPRLDLHALDLLVVLALGTGTAVAASVVPALHAARADVVGALAGRRGQGAPRLWVPVTGLVLVAAGLVTAVWAAYSYRPFVVALGLALGEFGLVALSGTLVVLISRVAPHLSLSGRLALRDAARNRGRTAPALAAVLAVVAGCCAAAVYTAALDAHDTAQYTPSAAMGDVLVQGAPTDLAHAEAAVRSVMPVRDVVPLRGFTGDVSVQPDDIQDSSRRSDSHRLLATNGPLVDEGAAVAALTGVDDGRVRAALRQGKVVVFGPEYLADGGRTVRLHVARELSGSSAAGTVPPPERVVTVPAVLVRLPLGLNAPVLPPSVLPALGAGIATAQWGVVATTTRMPTAEEEQRLATRVSDGSSYVERGYRSPYPVFLLVVGIASVVVALGATLAVVGLAAAEGRADVSTLAAVGAAPRVRRRLAAAQAGVVAVLGTALGCVSGIVSGVTLVVLSRGQLGGLPDSPAGSWEIVVPWDRLAVLVVGLPLLAVLAAALFTRSRLPMVRRLGQ